MLVRYCIAQEEVHHGGRITKQHLSAKVANGNSHQPSEATEMKITTIGLRVVYPRFSVIQITGAQVDFEIKPGDILYSQYFSGWMGLSDQG